MAVGLPDYLTLVRVFGAPRRSEQVDLPTPFEHLASLNRIVHEPARLAILTALSACDKADFLFLLNLSGLTKGNLSSHLTKLEQTGLIEIEKRFEGKQPVTYAMLSGEGREALKEYWKRFEQIRKGARALKPLKVT
jgi:DNA-binding transcriptional ArsR family regulator